jgi:hypothetical protein
MAIHRRNRLAGFRKKCGALSLSLAIVGAAALAWATPPIPPAKIILDERSIGKIGAVRSGALPIRLQFRENVSSLTILAKVRPVLENRPDFAQPPFETVLEQRLEATAIRRLTQETINIPVEKLKPGPYQLEILIQGKNENGGFSDKQVWRLIVEPDGRYRLLSPHDAVQQRTELQEKAFRAQLEKNPKNPDIRLLMDDTVKAPLTQARIGQLDVPEANRLLVRPVGPSERFKGYYQEHEGQSWSSQDPITVRGRLWFQDIDGVWKPLVNAAVHLWDDDTFGDEHLGSVATDWDGRWSFTVNNDDGFWQDGRDLYYTFKLENTRLKVGKCGGDYEWKSAVHEDLNDGIVLDFGDETASTDMDSLRVWSTLNLAWNHAATTGGQDPGFVDACFPGSGTFYNGKVNIASGDVDGPDSITHEYGHALMANANGSDPSPGGPHGFGDCNQNQALSWSEGWATGFMLSVRPDGTYNWHEGDGGRNIENFSSGCQLGETSEGRVAASLLDFMDSANDDNGGSLNRGRNDVSDANSGFRIPLATIFRDTLWGNSPNGNFLNYWTSLSGEVNSTQRSGGSNIMFYNWMSVPDPNACVATKVSTANLANPEPVLSGLRAFRDLALKKFPQGRQLINRYYRNSPEMAKLLLDNPASLPDALKVVTYFSSLGDTIRNNARYAKSMETNAAFIPEDVQASLNNLFALFGKQGGAGLKQETQAARDAYERYRGLTLPDLQETIIREKAETAPSDFVRLQTGQFTPESKNALRDPRIQSVLRRGLKQ